MKLSKKHIILSVLLPVQILFVQFISKKPQIIEHYYAKKLYPILSKILRQLFGWLPFSFGDVLILLCIILFIKSIYELIVTKFKHLFSKFIKFTAILSVIYFCFYTFWGFNYFREPLAKNLGLTQSKYTTEELLITTKAVIKELNKYHLAITKNDTIEVKVPYSAEDIYIKSVNGYNTLSKVYPQLRYEVPSVKSSLVSLFQSYNRTAGYINPLTNEAQVNSMIPKTSMPATTCHEIAHQVGWAAENDANFIGFLASISNDDLYFKYAGYRMAFSYLINNLRKTDNEKSKGLWKSINKGILKDFDSSYKHWQQFKNPIEPYSKKVYNSYLKANNQAKGIQSYSYVVDLLIAYYKTKPLWTESP